MIGWWLAKNVKGQAWVPAAYVEEQAPPPAPAPPPRAPLLPPTQNGVRPKPTPPQPPAKRPTAAKKPAALQPRDSGMSLNANGEGSRSSTPTPNLAGSLADALKARQHAMSSKREDEDDW